MNNNIKVINNDMLKETTYKKKLKNGLEVYICLKKGFEKKVGMFGTKYGSINNDFIDIETNKRIIVPDGIAHFLEHKLFEDEKSNALDLFSKEGISANAYTSFDHTVYFFETIDKFNKGLEMLIKLVKTPYFTEENVEKEKGIIAQEISMYEDEPSYISYFNTIRGMYINHPIKIDIAGTIESISKINKDILYTCYNTFYNLNNMFIVIVGDLDVESTFNMIEKDLKKYEKNITNKEIVKFSVEEPENIYKKKIEKNMQIYMPHVSIGYKLDLVQKNELIKREIIADIVSEMYFSKSSKFFEKEYSKQLVSDNILFGYEGSNEFSHVIISTMSSNPEQIKEDISKYINQIKEEEIDTKLFEIIKRKKIGESLIFSENLSNSYRRIIESTLNESDLYYDIEVLNTITINEVKEFLKLLDNKKSVVSIVK